MKLEEISTPSLLVDEDVLVGNLERMAEVVAGAGLRLRAHAKAHKCPQIALLQIQKGAVGICCQTVREVEEFSAAGVKDILLSNQIASRADAVRLAEISKETRVGVCIDHPIQCDLLQDAAKISNKTLDIFIEVDVGGLRCGVETPQEAADLIRLVAEASHLMFAGLQAYNGKPQHIYDLLKRADAVKATAAKTKEFVNGINERGFQIPCITGGGTGSLEQDVEDQVLTELQCGSYALMDADYQSLEFNETNDKFRFETALGVAARVISRREMKYAVIDAGLKAFSFDSGNPVVLSHPGLIYTNPSDEHGIILSNDGTPLPEIGEILVLTPRHCDPTVALYKTMHIIDDKKVKTQWPIVARGEW